MVLSHSLAPCHRDQFEHVAKFIPPIPKEPAVATPNDIRRGFEKWGLYGPFHVNAGDSVIRDRAGHPAFFATPSGSQEQRQAMAEDGCLALNLQCGFTPAEILVDATRRAAGAIYRRSSASIADAAE